MDDKVSYNVSGDRKTARSRTVLILFCICVVFLMVLVSLILVHQKTTREWATSYQSLQTSYDNLKKKCSDLQSEYNTLESMYDAARQPVESSESEQTPDFKESQSPVECYVDDYIAISYDHCEYESNYSQIFFLVENKTDVPLSICFTSISIDGWNSSRATGIDKILPKSRGYIGISIDDVSELPLEILSGSFLVADDSKTMWADGFYNNYFTGIDVKK